MELCRRGLPKVSAKSPLLVELFDPKFHRHFRAYVERFPDYVREVHHGPATGVKLHHPEISRRIHIEREVIGGPGSHGAPLIGYWMIDLRIGRPAFRIHAIEGLGELHGTAPGATSCQEAVDH